MYLMNLKNSCKCSFGYFSKLSIEWKGKLINVFFKIIALFKNLHRRLEKGFAELVFKL